ncbi:hypothetical protein GCK72_021285 [Caenorhabditis remanei]|uniref:F-box domain-containing protein n=1 Tax=Caenorhabditis remanei TaxID=31234 RepID=A0A6A5GJC7_CAERE|nr:hypothetical protein GCK72_021285 [Caenorhabditis remanei]KAF1754721.1 hypothetical protein GCK72_021285 [Caenorhabditis remanei]
MTTLFPLLRLPRLALIPVFQQMESIDVIAFSLLSKKAKNLSKIFRKLSTRSVHLIVESNHLDVSVHFEWWKEEGLKFYFNTENVPQLVNAMFQKRTFTHENSGLSPSQWLERVLDVTNCESIGHLDLKGSPHLDVYNLFASIQNIRKLYIFQDCDNIFAKKALEIVSPVTREIILFKIPFETREEFQTFLKSNLNYLNIHTSTFPTFKFFLEDLMITNALKLNLNDGKLNLKEINQFFKNWMEKKCDSRLEHLLVCTFEEVDEKNLLEGLKTLYFPRDRKRAFHYSKPMDSSSASFSGGYDIRRTDRKNATITFGEVWGETFINFYAWP